MRKHGHNLSHYVLSTLDLGDLVPVGLTEVLPGDTFRHSANVFARLSPLAAPVMHELGVRLHHFFVPHRIVWEEAGGTGSFEDFITGGNSGNDAQLVPTITSTGTAHDLLDYLGVPPVAGVEVSALPVAGYNRIFNEWYRDQDLVTARAWNDLTVAKIAWGKDYLSSQRPFAQRGDAVTVPITGTASVRGGPLVTAPGGPWQISTDASANIFVGSPATSGWEMVTSPASAANVTDVRIAFALQRFKELRAQFGARYPEYLARYGVRDPDGRIQVPEYLGGGHASVNISEVLQTALDAAGGRGYEVGDLYGHGVAALRQRAYRRRFSEWGYVHSFLSMRPQAMYADGIARSLLQQDREDFFLPELEQIGEQAVWKNEVYADSVDGDTTFGYAPRYQQYRGALNRITGEFRTVLDYWHLGRLFASDPALNETFVTCDPPKRIFNEQTQHSVWAMVRHRIGASRPVSRRATTRNL